MNFHSVVSIRVIIFLYLLVVCDVMFEFSNEYYFLCFAAPTSFNPFSSFAPPPAPYIPVGGYSQDPAATGAVFNDNSMTFDPVTLTFDQDAFAATGGFSSNLQSPAAAACPFGFNPMAVNAFGSTLNPMTNAFGSNLNPVTSMTSNPFMD
jgi:hypothetical protein